MHKFNIADADAAGESDPYVAPACLSSRNEIFKVKLISIKAYSPQDIISLIWVVHRKIDLQKKDN